MAPHGKRISLDKRWTPEPRYQERPLESFAHTTSNPYLTLHREIGPPLYPADEAQKYRGRWDTIFGEKRPLYAEIGSGNGFFLSGYAKIRPDIHIVGVEIRLKRVVMCARKITESNLNNAIITRYDAWYLDDLFLPGSLDGLFVLHPDPWPKQRHGKNRLISRWFLELAQAVLAPGGALRIKSDYTPNVSRVFELLDTDDDGAPAPKLALDITAHSEDIIQGGPIWSHDVETNYQSKFRHKGLPVSAIELTKPRS